MIVRSVLPASCWLFLLAHTLVSTIALADPSAAELKKLWSAYLTSNAGVISTKSRFPYQSCFEAASARYDIPVTLLLAVARGESDFDPRAVSKANAIGVMQIRWPQTARHLGIPVKRRLYDPCVNIDAGARYLAELLHTFGDLHLAVLAYNRGPGTVSKAIQSHSVDRNIWYSSYVYDHLRFIVEREGAPRPALSYADTGRLAIITFDAPFRARALVEHLSTIAPGFQFDWFKNGRSYQVMFQHESQRERVEGMRILKRHGILKS